MLVELRAASRMTDAPPGRRARRRAAGLAVLLSCGAASLRAAAISIGAVGSGWIDGWVTRSVHLRYHVVLMHKQ